MVPLNPKELTPCGTDAGGGAVGAAVGSAARPSSTCGLSVRRWALGARGASSAATTPTSPAAASACATLALQPASVSAGVRTRATAPTSMGSPRDVPVPWHSRCGAPPARSSSPTCDAPLGAVRLADRPSCPTTTSTVAAPPPLLRRRAAPHASPRA